MFFNPGLDQTLYASVASGGENSNLFFSAERTENQGVFNNVEGYERYGVRLNGDFKINDWLKLSVSNNFIRSIDNSPGNRFDLEDMLFSLVVSDPDVNLNAVNPDGQPHYFLPNPWASTVQNPLYEVYNRERSIKQNRYLGSYKMNVKFTDWLNLDAEYAIEVNNTNVSDLDPYTTYIASSATEYGFDYNKGALFRSASTETSQKAQFTLNYADTYGDLSLKGQLSYLLEDYNFDSFYTRGREFIYPGIISMDNFDSANIFSSSSYQSEIANNFYAIAGIDYKDRYILDAMYRIDQSSLFGSEYRTNDYFRVSGAYRISKDFEIPGVQEMKIHAAYGTAGQRPQFDWQYDQIEIIEGALETDRIKASPNLKPSVTSELEVGLNVDFLDRFSFEGVYSQAKTEDQFMLVDIFSPVNEGANKQWQNVGTVEFNTIELMLNANVIKKENLSWDLGLRFERTRNEITELNVAPITVGPDGGEIFRLEEGVQFGTMYGRDFVRTLNQMENQLAAGESIDDYSVNSDGVVVLTESIGTTSEAPIILLDEEGEVAFKEIGSQAPDFRAGITSTLSFHGFNFYMLWDWQQGGDIYNRQGQWLTRDNRSAISDQANVADGSKKTLNYYQGLYDVNQDNAFWVEDGSYVKLREVSLAYTFGKDQLQNVANGFFDSLRISLTGRNLLTFTNYSGWDPEIQKWDIDTDNYYAVDYGVYPVPSSYNMSIQIKF